MSKTLYPLDSFELRVKAVFRKDNGYTEQQEVGHEYTPVDLMCFEHPDTLARKELGPTKSRKENYYLGLFT